MKIMIKAILVILLSCNLTINAQNKEINWTDVAPTWSSDGSKIYFYSYRDGNAELYVMNPDGSNQTRLTNTEYNEWWMQPTQDGKLLFVSDRDADKPFKGSNLYLFDLNSKNVTKLTDETGEWWAVFPKLSRSTGLVVYSRLHTFGLNVPVDIWILDMNNGKKYAYPDDPNHNNISPTISEDGKFIYYSSKRDGTVIIYKNSIVGNSETALYQIDGRADALSVSPDGKWLSFSVRNNIRSLKKLNENETPSSASQREIYIGRTDGSEVKRLTSSKGMNMEASWSPNSKSITFHSSRHGFLDIFSIDIDGQNEKNLTRTSIKGRSSD